MTTLADGPPPLDELVERAKAGDRAALEALIGAIQDRVYNLSLRMLWHPADAEDATQEILIRVVTHLGSFRGESAFTTWVYRVAANHLLTTRKRRAEREELTFDRFAEQLDAGLASETPDPALLVERRELVEEVKIGCTLGMLLCLDRDHRLAYILSAVFELPSHEAAAIAGVAPATFRKRLQRARQRLHGFMQAKCGLVNSENRCRCARRVDHAIEVRRIEPDRLRFALPALAASPDTVTASAVTEMERLHEAADLFRGHPRYAAPGAVAESVRSLLDGSTLRVLNVGRR